jgi:hypothetical protein
MNKEIQALRAAVTQQTNRVNTLSSQLNNLKLSPSNSSGPQGPRPGKSARKRNRRRALRSGDVTSPVVSRGMNNLVATDTAYRRLMASPRNSNISEQGLSFLKNAFAPPDFIQSDLQGVPDDYQNNSLVKKHKLVSPLVISATFDYYYLLLPVPGVAFFGIKVAAGAVLPSTTMFYPVYYSDFPSLFGPNASTTSDLVTKFRFVSNHIEVIPTVNANTWSGSIQAWKIPVAQVVRPPATADSTSQDIEGITGLSGVNSTNSNQYTAPFIMGFYGSCFNADCDFQFNTITEGVTNIPKTIGAADWGQLFFAPNGAFTGLDSHFESLIIKISGVTDNDQSMIIKTWATIEYQVQPNNMIYEFASLSPQKDEMSLQLYRQCIQDLPVGVSYIDNDSFWKRVVGIIGRVTGFTSMIPGPIGGISRGVNLISNTLSSFLK